MWGLFLLPVSRLLCIRFRWQIYPLKPPPDCRTSSQVRVTQSERVWDELVGGPSRLTGDNSTLLISIHNSKFRHLRIFGIYSGLSPRWEQPAYRRAKWPPLITVSNKQRRLARPFPISWTPPRRVFSSLTVVYTSS